jgi:hypothetical protein
VELYSYPLRLYGWCLIKDGKKNYIENTYGSQGGDGKDGSWQALDGDLQFYNMYQYSER